MLKQHNISHNIIFSNKHIENAPTTLIGEKFETLVGGEELKRNYSWWGTVKEGVNGCIYGIPHAARQVLKFNPSMHPSLALDLTSVKNCGSGLKVP